MSLKRIKNSVQEVAEAIAAVLHVDVTIIDNEFKRIAATGSYKKLIGNKIPSRCLFELVIEEKKPHYVMRNPLDGKENDHSLVCNICEAKDKCSEYATIGYPIMKDNEVIGIIGINVCDEEQCSVISKDFDSMLVFLNKLSTLLVGNIIYNDSINKLQIQREETNHIIDSLSHGILCVDNDGFIKFVNKKGEKLLEITEKAAANNNIKNIIPDFKIELLGKDSKGKRVSIRGKNQSFLIKSSPIILNGERVSNIVEFNRKSDEVRDAYKLVGSSRVVKFDDIIGESNSVKNVKLISKNIAKTDSTVLLRGESGTGKELFARSIHFESQRYDAPFIAINCASIPDNLLESEFFGYEGGCFTGSKRDGQIGKFELANGGTIFLDEIGDLPLHLQPKILRVLQERSFTRIGGKEEIYVDVRVIAATNRDLESMVKNKEFREDLYYRLNVIPIYLPSLKERGEDIFLLSKYLMNKFCCRFHMDCKELSEEIKSSFMNYSWPGNIRELENVIEYLVNTSTEDVISCNSLPSTFKTHNNCMKSSNKDLKTMVSDFEKDILLSMLNKHGYTAEGKDKIIEELNIDLSTLYRKLKKYDLQ